jgi:RNA polymerase sigma-70 factor (ECF subfamily)
VTASPRHDDQALVLAAQGGDRAALDELLRTHYDRVFAVCRRITGNEADAADAAQEAMIALVRGLQRFDGRSAFSTWAYRVATNASLDELRRRRRRPVAQNLAGEGGHDERQAPELGDPSAGLPFDRIGEREAIEAALVTLPDEFRVPVVLRDVADLEYADIADILGVPVGTVKSRIARGRAQLAGRLRPPGNLPDDSQRPTEAP